jgi:hypothetical protein
MLVTSTNSVSVRTYQLGSQNLQTLTCMWIVSVYAGEEKKEHKWGFYRDKGMNVLREPPFNIGHALLNSSDMDPVSEPGQ